MIFTETPLAGAYVIDLERRGDDRGYFARTFCAREFAQHGLDPRVVQANLSGNHRAGTLRGMHLQLPPTGEPKVVRCLRGAIWDVIVDLRPDSPTYLRHFGVELTADSHRALYVPQMFAHGYQALTDGAEVLYLVGEYYTPAAERGLRHDDPALGLSWPLPVTELSPKDAAWPLLGQGAEFPLPAAGAPRLEVVA